MGWRNHDRGGVSACRMNVATSQHSLYSGYGLQHLNESLLQAKQSKIPP